LKTYNWAILGCGRIASKFANDLKLLPNAKLYATAARDLERSRQFADNYGFEKAYGSYEEMVDDPGVDIVYIATPHSYHRDHTILCLNHKKAVLCEKAFAINSREASEMIECAKRNNTFLMEAFWTRFQPSFNKALEILQSGRLGTLKIVRSDFAFKAEFNPERRLYNLNLGGGSLLDIGIYPVFASLITLGKPSEIRTLAEFSSTGTEESVMILFKYPGGQMATLTSSFACHSSIETEFWCEKGILKLNRRWQAPTTISIWESSTQKENLIETGTVKGTGYSYEAAHVMQCLDQEKKESEMMPLSFSLDMMKILDQVRKDANIVFPKHD